jgi:uncharacterized membrane protein YgcG
MGACTSAETLRQSQPEESATLATSQLPVAEPQESLSAVVLWLAEPQVQVATTQVQVAEPQVQVAEPQVRVGEPLQVAASQVGVEHIINVVQAVPQVAELSGLQHPEESPPPTVSYEQQQQQEPTFETVESWAAVLPREATTYKTLHDMCADFAEELRTSPAYDESLALDLHIENCPKAGRTLVVSARTKSGVGEGQWDASLHVDLCVDGVWNGVQKGLAGSSPGSHALHVYCDVKVSDEAFRGIAEEAALNVKILLATFVQGVAFDFEATAFFVETPRAGPCYIKVSPREVDEPLNADTAVFLVDVGLELARMLVQQLGKICVLPTGGTSGPSAALDSFHSGSSGSAGSLRSSGSSGSAGSSGSSTHGVLPMACVVRFIDGSVFQRLSHAVKLMQLTVARYKQELMSAVLTDALDPYRAVRRMKLVKMFLGAAFLWITSVLQSNRFPAMRDVLMGVA